MLCPECVKIEGLEIYHSHECKLFCSLPLDMRNGDTDYLRFVLRYLFKFISYMLLTFDHCEDIFQFYNMVHLRKVVAARGQSVSFLICAVIEARTQKRISPFSTCLSSLSLLPSFDY